MTTLPPEDDRSGAGGQPDQPQQPEPPQVPEPPLDPPQAPEQPQEPLGQPQAPQAPQQPHQPQAPQAPQQPSSAPQQGYQAPPQQPGYQQAPPPGAYQQPGGYQQQPGGGYQPPAGGYPQAPVSDPVSNITLNYWLSVFFAWIPALIFYMIEKDKGDQRAYVYHRDNLNFSLVRTIVYAAIIVVGWIPYIGWILAGLLWLGQIVLFVFHIIAAVKAPDGFRRGEQPNFIFNLPLVR